MEGMPLSRALAVTTASRSGRAGIKAQVTARPTIFFPGGTTIHPPSNWLYGAPRPPPPPAPPRPPPPPAPPAGAGAATTAPVAPQLILISSCDRPRARLMMLSGTLGRPSGKRSPVQA